MPAASMRLALAQTQIVYQEPMENLTLAVHWMQQAANCGAQCILFPEMSFTGFSMQPEKTAPWGRRSMDTMCTFASAFQLAVGFGYVGTTFDGQYQNHYCVIDACGKTLTDFVKLHPFSYTGEERIYSPGDTIICGDLCGIPYSTLLCYDLRFPEVFRLASQHAHVLIVPANWLSIRHTQFQLLLRARAIENQAYVVGINCVGTQGNNHFLGGSCVVDPEGNVRLDCGNQAALRLFDLTDDTQQFRASFSCREDARLSWYSAQYQCAFTADMEGL